MRPTPPSPEAIERIRREYEAMFAPFRADVRQFIDPTWDVAFHFDRRWWFDSSDMNGSFAGSVIEVAVYVDEYHRSGGRWPTCAEHGSPLNIAAFYGRTDGITWMCDGPPPHGAEAGHLASIAG